MQLADDPDVETWWTPSADSWITAHRSLPEVYRCLAVRLVFRILRIPV